MLTERQNTKPDTWVGDAQRQNSASDTLVFEGYLEGNACAECGHRIPQGGDICPRCGAKLPTNFALYSGIAAGFALMVALLIFATFDFSPKSAKPGALDRDVGPGSNFAIEHPTLIPNITTMIRSHGHRCPVLVDLWNEPAIQTGTLLEAICGPDKNNIDASLHYAVYFESQTVKVCRPWKEFGPNCD